MKIFPTVMYYDYVIPTLLDLRLPTKYDKTAEIANLAYNYLL